MFWLVLWLTVTLVICVTAVLPVTRKPLHTRLADIASRAWNHVHPRPPLAPGPPIEDLAASLRRCQRWLDTYADPRPIPGKATKWIAATDAYDRVLIAACHALDVPEDLAGTEGLDREAERLRMQAALGDAGFVLSGRRQADR
jgi:hypothetical protein